MEAHARVYSGSVCEADSEQPTRPSSDEGCRSACARVCLYTEGCAATESGELGERNPKCKQGPNCVTGTERDTGKETSKEENKGG